MKSNVLSAFHYLLFFDLMFLLTPLRTLHQPERTSECDENSNLKIEKSNEIRLAKENTTELLHSGLLFKY